MAAPCCASLVIQVSSKFFENATMNIESTVFKVCRITTAVGCFAIVAIYFDTNWSYLLIVSATREMR